MTMMEDFNQWNPPTEAPLGDPWPPSPSFPTIKTAEFQTDPFIGERIDESMQWQSPARNQILQDFNLNPATTGAGFQMQGTNTPTIVTDMMGNTIDYPTAIRRSADRTSMGVYRMNQIDPLSGAIVESPAQTAYYNLQDNAFPMGSPVGTGTISSIVSPQSGFSDDYGLRINRGNPALYNYGTPPFDYAQAARNFNFPMGGRYNYSTTPGFGAGWSDPIINYDPYNALANTGMYGYGFSQPNFPIMENYIPDPVLDPRGYQMFDPFQSYR